MLKYRTQFFLTKSDIQIEREHLLNIKNNFGNISRLNYKNIVLDWEISLPMSSFRKQFSFLIK